ncbi:hypothetical protein ACGGAI_28870 [Streptomyces antibioticus]|uniref:hypothetical protein n=1 Tax=Streptomyces antibioticus TaxID=1890 RepID=UPI0037243058
MREADYKANFANAYSQGNEPRLVSVISGGHDELWAVGSSLFVIPAVPADAPPLLEYAIRLRREATLTGKCAECKAAVGLGTFGQFVNIPFGEAAIPHRRNCPAADENLKSELRRHRQKNGDRSLRDAIKSASDRTREKVSEGVGNKVMVSSPRFKKWAVDLLDAKVALSRCGHLQSDPAQTWNSYIADSEWRCDQCFAYLQESILKGEAGFDEDEERTCDHCRQLSEALEPVVIRIDHFFMIGGVCAGCAKQFNPVVPPKKVKKRGRNGRKRR